MKSKELEDLTAQCIRCGFCLESCPTFKLTGSESDSPRGRIYLLRSAQAGTIPLETARGPIDRCLGCQACETACPSAVQYGKILSQGRTLLEKQKPSLKKRFLLNLLTNPSTSGIAVKGGILTRKLPKPTPLPPRPPILLENPKGEVLLLEGCVMKHLYPEVHIATKRLVNAVGYRIRSLDAGCCGALHAHNGYLEIAKSMSDRLKSQAGNTLILTNSAGCGSFLKEQGLPVKDISEFLLENGLPELLAQGPGFPHAITYHDACHLCHAQGIRTAPRALLEAIPNLKLISLQDSDQCCGSAGIYQTLQPEFATKLQTQKIQRIKETGAKFLVQGNPGCHSWIQQGLELSNVPVQVVHLAELLNQAI